MVLGGGERILGGGGVKSSRIYSQGCAGLGGEEVKHRTAAVRFSPVKRGELQGRRDRTVQSPPVPPPPLPPQFIGVTGGKSPPAFCAPGICFSLANRFEIN